MIHHLKQLEEKRRKLNKLGQELLNHSNPLAHNQEVQRLSQKVDELMICYYHFERTCSSNAQKRSQEGG